MKSIGLIVPPHLSLRDREGTTWNTVFKNYCNGSIPLIAGSLEAAGYSVSSYFLNSGNDCFPVNTVDWEGVELTEYVIGTHWQELAVGDHDVWGVTSNFHQFSDVALMVIRHIAQQGGRIVVGGSDTIAQPQKYIDAGASVVVLDKTGESNPAAIEYALSGRIDENVAYHLYVKDGGVIKTGRPRLKPDEWALPSIGHVAASLGTNVWNQDSHAPVLALPLDIGCDRKCDFCQTPTYGFGYRHMSVEGLKPWVSLMKEAGARSLDIISDQFLGRILHKSKGRERIFEILDFLAAEKIPWHFKNGIEYMKLTRGRGIKTDAASLELDHELIARVLGRSGSKGCGQILFPAERPLQGAEAYAKLSPEWETHLEVLKSAVSAGLPSLFYVFIIGFPEDDEESLSRLYEKVSEVRKELLKINPALNFTVSSNGISTFPGVPITGQFIQEGVRPSVVHPSLLNKWTPLPTKSLTAKEVLRWIVRFQEEFTPIADQKRKGMTSMSLSTVEKAIKGLL